MSTEDPRPVDERRDAPAPLADAPPPDSAASTAERRLARDCPLCGGREGPEVLRSGDWRLIECSGCGLAYMPEVPSDQAIETDFEWAESFKREKWERWMRNPFFRAATFVAILVRPPREYRAMRRVRRFLPPPARMLDVGCGNGRLVAAALRMGYDAKGVELSPKMVAKARRRLAPQRILCGRLGEFGLRPGSFDLITSVSYLEHEPKPLEVLRQCHALLRSGGVCAHKTPNYDSRLRGVLGRRWSGYRWPEHVQYFSPRTAPKLLDAAGFETVDVFAPPWGDNMWCVGRKRG